MGIAAPPGWLDIRPCVGFGLHPDPPANGTRYRRPARWPTRRGGLHPPGVASPVLLTGLVQGYGPRSGLRTRVLAEDRSQVPSRLRCQLPGVVVEDDVHLLR